MLPFDSRIVAGRPASEQVVASVHRAIAGGQLKPGDEFPSVRKMSLDIGINPNTAQKIVATLVRDGVLEVHPGRGTRVTQPKPESVAARAKQLSPAIAEIVVLAKRLGSSPEEFDRLVRREWEKLGDA